MFYPSIADSWWVGGTEDQGGMIYQQAPYWLNGFLPLAYQLKNAGIEVLTPKCGLSPPRDEQHGGHGHGGPASGRGGGPVPAAGPVNPLAQVKTYIDGIMDRVQPSGWVGPPVVGGSNPGTPTTSSCEAGLNLYGGDIGGGTGAALPAGSDSSACAAMCQADASCAAYVFEQCAGRPAYCWLKRGGWKPQPSNSSGCELCSQVVRDQQWAKPGNGDNYWGPTNVMLALIGYAEAERPENPQIFACDDCCQLARSLARLLRFVQAEQSVRTH